MPGRVGLLELLSGRVSIEPYRKVPIRPVVQSRLEDARPRDATIERYGPRKIRSTLRLIKPQTKKKIKEPKEATEYIISPIHFETLDSSCVTKDQTPPPSYNTAETRVDPNKTIDGIDSSFLDSTEAFNLGGRLQDRNGRQTWNPNIHNRLTRQSSAGCQSVNKCFMKNLPSTHSPRSRSELEQRYRMFRSLLNRVALDQELDVNTVLRRWRALRLLMPTSRVTSRDPRFSLSAMSRINRPADLALRRSRVARLRHYT